MRTSKITFRLISALLALVILLGALPLSVIAEGVAALPTDTAPADKVGISEDKTGISVLHGGAEKSAVSIPKNGRDILTVFTSGIEPTHLAWQILAPDTNTWVNIYGRNGAELPISYSLVGSMLDGNGIAFVRASAVAEGKSYISEPVGITVSETVEDYAYAGIPQAEYANRLMADGEEYEIFSIVINYIFDNGALAHEPFGASVAKNSSFVESIPSPSVVGYEPFIRTDSGYEKADNVEFNIASVTENVTVNVIYEPALVDFEVHHHLQNLYDDDYSLHPDYKTYGKALTGSPVPDGLAKTEDELPGFTALAYEKITVAADGSTAVEIRYDRKYYLVNFDMMGGYGTEPVFARFGSEVGANTPTRHGYIFDGWELVSYGGAAPTAEQKSMYDINSSIITVPNASLTYRARWITQSVSYTMVFWKENIDDNGFSYWGSLDGLTAMSGSYVDGADRIDEVGSIDDRDYFTYNADLTDKSVMVEGDGSTIVNVYYTRNRYSITFKAPGLCVIPEGHIHTDECYDLLCTKGHIHTEECNPTLICTKQVHEEHTDECIVCGIEAHEHSSACCGISEHTHSTSCYNSIGAEASPSGAPTGVESGYIYAVRSGWRYTYYIYIGGSWYRYNGWNVSSGDVVNARCGNVEHTHGTADCSCSKTPHSHVASCYGDEIHVHNENECFSYTCGDDWHVHGEGCRVLHCGLPTGHTHTSTCRSSSSENTVKIELRKYQENLESIWPITDGNGVTYDSGERWMPSGSSTYSMVLVYIANMPGESFTLTLDTSSNDTYTMNYYLEVLEGEAYDTTYDGRNFIHYTTVKANYNYISEAEDFFDINGYYKLSSSPAFSNGQIDINGGGTINFYYGRIVDHYLQFRSNGVILNAKTVHGIAYGASLKEYFFEPDYPTSLEPNAYVFAGWYTTAGHFDGTEVDWDTITMDAGDVMLYAKWEPIVHSVKVYLDSSKTEQIGETQYVSHYSFAVAPSETVTNGIYVFQGWFYTDHTDGGSVEKAFVFTGIPVIEDLEIYAKWSSHVTVNYTIHYVDQLTGNQIAPTLTGSGLAGHNKTFYAKTGNELDEGYRQRYFPLTASHTVTMSAEGDHEFTFYYTYVAVMPYLVRYLDEDGNSVLEDKYVMDNSLSVVTETFIRVSEMMPDAYQKRLLLAASGDDEDGDGVYDDNVIIFRYSRNLVNAYYKIVHYIENISADGYREFRSQETVGIIGESYTVSALEITGFSFNGALTVINGTAQPVSGKDVTAELTSEGLLVEMYYDRVEVGYTVKYLEQNTNKVLYTEKKGQGIFGEQAVEYAPGLTHLGYKLVGDSVKQLHLAADESVNVIEFYYEESVYSLKYQTVGSPDGARLSIESENVKAVTGTPVGSQPLMNSGYHFVGWYFDEACTRPVPEEWVNPDNHRISPVSDGVWLASHTYFARIEPDFTSMTVGVIGCADVDAGQTFFFRIQGVSDNCLGVDITVTVVGNSSVTVNTLAVGEYRVTELTAWSYRYTPDSAEKLLTLGVIPSANEVTFSHARSVTKWLDGNASADNVYD